MEWKTKCPRWPLITGKPLRYDGFSIVSKLYWGGGLWIPYLKSIVIIGVSFDDTAPKEKNTKYKVKPITKGKSLMIIFRPCLIRDDREHNFPKVIIFQSFYPPGIPFKALYEEAPARDPTPYSFRNMHFSTEKVPFWLTYHWKMMLSKPLKQGRIWCVF